MKSEIEVRVLDIDIEDIKKRLEENNALLEWDLLQRRYIYNFVPDVKGKWIRLRTNGKKSTLAVKNIVSSNIDGTKELEIEIDDFDKCNHLLQELGYKARLYQENRRIKYNLNGVEVDIDYWPLIPTYLEIEGKCEDEVYKTLEQLGFKREDCTTLHVGDIYRKYGFDLDSIADLKLEEDRK